MEIVPAMSISLSFLIIGVFAANPLAVPVIVTNQVALYLLLH